MVHYAGIGAAMDLQCGRIEHIGAAAQEVVRNSDDLAVFLRLAQTREC